MKISVKNTFVAVAITTATLSSFLTINTKSADATGIDTVDQALSTVSYNSCHKHDAEGKDKTNQTTSTTQK
ncbi:MAG: hypothetical protein ACRC2J_14155 [Microcoleaceae cyanobacterium]